uniref:Uncharacterized protein n=1 Tax=Kalanchoe fedtschenkoi TaxID=63787 RepID=A0A7N0TUX1_KALFE
HARRRIWDNLLYVNRSLKVPWIIGGDFNVISCWEEKKGGRFYDDGSMYEFNSFIIQSGIYKRIDKVFINPEGLIKFPEINLTLLPRILSDHTPLLVCLERHIVRKSSFKFMRMWCEHDSFYPFVIQCWNEISQGPGLFNLAAKLSHLRSRLKLWNRNVFGDVDQQLDGLTFDIQSLDDSLCHGWNADVFTKLQEKKAQFRVWQNRKYMMLEDKANLHWLKEGDRNSKVFHAAIKDRVSINRISIKVEDGSYCTDSESIGRLAVSHFSELFSGQRYYPDTALLQDVPRMITAEDNEHLSTRPGEEEIKKAVFDLSAVSAPGPDRFTGAFYHKCWDIIGKDVVVAIHQFWEDGTILPRSISSANI